MVKLTKGGSGQNAFLTGPLNLPSGVSLWVDSGVTLYASRRPADYEAGAAGYCGDAPASTPSGSGCKALITVAAGASNSGIYGSGTIDGRGGSVLTSGTNAGVMTWWDVAMINKVKGYTQNCPTLIDASKGGSNLVLSQIALLNSPHFHVKIDSYNGVVVWDAQVLTPSLAYSVANYACTTGRPSTTALATAPSTCFTPDDTKNTDGIDPGGSNNVTIAYSYISDGDDNIAVTASNSGSCPTTTVNGFCSSSTTKIAHNHFYWGHGMSIGSGTAGGVSGMQVWDLAINGGGSSNGVGLRIKSDASRGGDVTASYLKVCIKDVKQPLWIDPFYSSTTLTSLPPNYHDVSMSNIHVVDGATYKGGTILFSGYNAMYPLKNLTLDNVYFDTAPAWGTNAKNGGYAFSPAYASIILGSGSTNFAIPANTGVTTSGTANTATSANALDCGSAFVSFNSVNSNAPM